MPTPPLGCAGSGVMGLLRNGKIGTGDTEAAVEAAKEPLVCLTSGTTVIGVRCGRKPPPCCCCCLGIAFS